MSRKKVLIHLHPSTSFLGRCLSLLNLEDECILINGPSNFTKENKNFVKWFFLNLKQLKDSKLNLSIYSFKKKLILKYIKNFFVLKLSHQNKSYFKDAVIDSIIRKNKLASLYYKSIFFEILFKFFYSLYCRLLISIYITTLDDLQIDLVIISHAVYMNYGSLLIAAIEKNIKVNIVSGGFSNSYFISKDLDSYHIARYYKYLYQKFEANIKVDIKGEADNAISNEKGIKFIRPSRKYPADTLIICSHCFADNNHIGDSKKMLYETYYEWLDSTLKILDKEYNPTFKNYIIKVHPYIEIYKEKFLLNRIIKKFSNWEKINLKICNQNQNISDLISQENIFPVFLTVHGQICHELGTIGLPVIACGTAQGPLYNQYNPSSIEEYRKILKNNIYATECLESLSNSRFLKKESISYQTFHKSLFPSGDLKSKLWKLREYFNFHIETKKIDEEFIMILTELKKMKPPSTLSLKNGFGVFVPNKN